MLRAEIGCHVTWRDRMLVAQAQALVVIEPFYSSAGKMAGSVALECELYEQLRGAGAEDVPEAVDAGARTRRPMVVYLPPASERRRRVRAMAAVLLDMEREGSINVLPRAELEGLEAELLADAKVDSWHTMSHGALGQLVSQKLSALPSRPALVPGGADAELGRGMMVTRAGAAQAMLGKRVAAMMKGEGLERFDARFDLTLFVDASQIVVDVTEGWRLGQQIADLLGAP